MAGAATSPRARRRLQIRGQLIAVVEELLDQGESFADLSVERLAQAAGMSRSTFYLYFEDKNDLLRSWFSSVSDEIGEAVTAWWALGPDVARDDVRAALAELVGTYRPHVTLMAATYDAAAYDPALRELTDGLVDSSAAGLRKHIRRGQQAGFVDAGLRPVETAGWLTWMAERGLHRLVRGASDAEVERLIDGYADIVFKTLYVPRP
ncbi:MAG TPA: TetR/AcrR family transcriptional regulator [Baekduia sp.]|nr:TetR/AcrR family transcriptional regulator [Baekduia sp.]